MNLYPEMTPDTARHPPLVKGRVKETDLVLPYDADYPSSYATVLEGEYRRIQRLRHWYVSGGANSEYYWQIFNAQAGPQSPLVAIFADKAERTLGAWMSAPGLVISDNWMDSGEKGTGFDVQSNKGSPDARAWPLVRTHWALFVSTKAEGLKPLGQEQPVLKQMDLHAGLVPKLANVHAKIPELPRLNWEERSDWINVKTDVMPPAIGDGIADDTFAIQAALDSLKEQGYNTPNTVYLPAGTYRITRTLR